MRKLLAFGTCVMLLFVAVAAHAFFGNQLLGARGSSGGGGGGIPCTIGPNYTGTVPAKVTTLGWICAANYDLTQTLSGSWLDCSGPLGEPPSSPPAGALFFYNSNNSCSNVVQTTDGATLAVNMPLLSSDDLSGSELDTIATFPNAYYQVVFRFQTTPDPGLTGGYNSPGAYLTHYQWYYPYPSTPAGLEQDSVEEFFGGATQYVSDGFIDWNAGGTGPHAFGGGSAPSDYDPRLYHTWSTLYTSNGTAQGQEGFLDGSLLGSVSYNFTAPEQATNRHWSKLTLAIDCAFLGLGDASCVNHSVNNIYQCGSNICVHFSTAIGFLGGGSANYGSFSGVTGTGGLPAAVNKQFNNIVSQSGCAGNNLSCTDINLNVAWPGGSYTSGGTYNPFTRVDSWIQSLVIFACPAWQTTMCQTSPVNP